MDQLLHSIGVNTVKIAAQIDPQQAVRIICGCRVLYVMAMNGLVNILVDRQSTCQELVDAALPCLPMDLIKTSVVDFVSLVGNNKYRLRSAF